MTVSKNVVIFAVASLSVVMVDFLVAGPLSLTQSECQETRDDSTKAALNNMATIARNQANNTSVDSFNTNDRIITMPVKLTENNTCFNQAEHSVSWMDWVFSWQDSPTFHYLDLLELLTSKGDDNDSYHSGHGQRSPVK